MEKTSDPNDPRGLIFESYRMADISAEQCRTIFLDWALGIPEPQLIDAVKTLHSRYAPTAPNHPMSAILFQAITTGPATRKRQGGWRSRR